MDSLFDLVLGFIKAEGLLLKQSICIDTTIIDSATRSLSKEKRAAFERSPSSQMGYRYRFYRKKG